MARNQNMDEELITGELLKQLGSEMHTSIRNQKLQSSRQQGPQRRDDHLGGDLCADYEQRQAHTHWRVQLSVSTKMAIQTSTIGNCPNWARRCAPAPATLHLLAGTGRGACPPLRDLHTAALSLAQMPSVSRCSCWRSRRRCAHRVRHAPSSCRRRRCACRVDASWRSTRRLAGPVGGPAMQSSLSSPSTRGVADAATNACMACS